MNNRAFRVDDNSINSFTPSYADFYGAIATTQIFLLQLHIPSLKIEVTFDAAAGAMLVESLVNPRCLAWEEKEL